MSLSEIGQKLKVARETQGLTLRQIYERTKIPLGHLQSIDNGQTDDLPEPVYVAGFIKRYADCVGLNGQVLSEQYRRFNDEQPGNGRDQANKVLLAQPQYTAIDLKHARPDHGPPTFKTIYFNAIWIVVVIGLVSYLSMTQLNNMANQQDPSLLSLRESTSKFNGQINPQTPMSTVGTTKDQDGGAAKIALSASQHVWVEVKALSTGESLFTGYMEQGDRRDYQDSQGLSVRAGNGGSLTYEYEGKTATLGAPGKVADRSFVSRSTTAAAEEPDSNAKTTTAPSQKKWSATRPTVRTKKEPNLASRSHYRNVDDVPSRQYLPGESLGGSGTRSLDVPYRYSEGEGRLDAE